MEEDLEDIEIKHDLTQDERNEMNTQLTDKLIEISEVEDEKKAKAAQFKARLDGLNGDVNLLARQLRDGYIFYTVSAERRRNYLLKRWEYVNPETGELLKSEPFMGRDFQMRVGDNFEDPIRPLRDFINDHNVIIEAVNPMTGETKQLIPDKPKQGRKANAV